MLRFAVVAYGRYPLPARRSRALSLALTAGLPAHLPAIPRKRRGRDGRQDGRVTRDARRAVRARRGYPRWFSVPARFPGPGSGLLGRPPGRSSGCLLSLCERDLLPSRPESWRFPYWRAVLCTCDTSGNAAPLPSCRCPSWEVELANRTISPWSGDVKLANVLVRAHMAWSERRKVSEIHRFPWSAGHSAGLDMARGGVYATRPGGREWSLSPPCTGGWNGHVPYPPLPGGREWSLPWRGQSAMGVSGLSHGGGL